MQFRKMMMEVTTKSTINDKGEVKKTTGVDPFDYISIALECQVIYRELFLEEEYQTEYLVEADVNMSDQVRRWKSTRPVTTW